MMIGPARVTKHILRIMADTMIKSTAVSMISLAESLRCSPRLLATSADIETFSAKKRASPKSLGCVVSPTAATEAEPRELTISESINPANAIKKDSIIAGHAILIAIFKVSL